MCIYCEDRKPMMQEEVLSPSLAAWCGETKGKDLANLGYYLSVFMDDRGYLRLVDLYDSGCLDHGQKIEINYCPICGVKIEKGDK